MDTTSEFIKRAAKRAGYRRDSYVERNLPTQPSNILAVPLYGDIRSVFTAATFLLRSYKEANRDKYLILCSWPGFRGLFPYADEFWSVEDESVCRLLAAETCGFANNANVAAELTRSLVEVLDVMTAKDLSAYYSNGFTHKYMTDFREVMMHLPEVPSVSRVADDLRTQLSHRKGGRIVIYPATRMRSWQRGRAESLPVGRDFWLALANTLIDAGYTPVVYQNWFTHDLSRDLADRCVYLASKDVSEVLAAIRHVGCVLDVHTDVSKLAVMARCPFLSVTERMIYVNEKDCELDDLCCDGLGRQYIFSFSTQLMQGGPEDWKSSVLDNVTARLAKFLPRVADAETPPTTERWEKADYTKVRMKRAKHLGSRFIRTAKRS